MDRPASVRGALTEAKGIAAGIPDMLVEARRVAATVLAGWHGRRVSGRGETFWQFRPFTTGEPAASIDWRRLQSRMENMTMARKADAFSVWGTPAKAVLDGLKPRQIKISPVSNGHGERTSDQPAEPQA